MDPASRDKTPASELRVSGFQDRLSEKLSVTQDSSCQAQGDAHWADSAAIVFWEETGR